MGNLSVKHVTVFLLPLMVPVSVAITKSLVNRTKFVTNTDGKQVLLLYQPSTGAWCVPVFPEDCPGPDYEVQPCTRDGLKDEFVPCHIGFQQERIDGNSFDMDKSRCYRRDIVCSSGYAIPSYAKLNSCLAEESPCQCDQDKCAYSSRCAGGCWPSNKICGVNEEPNTRTGVCDPCPWYTSKAAGCGACRPNRTLFEKGPPDFKPEVPSRPSAEVTYTNTSVVVIKITKGTNSVDCFVVEVEVVSRNDADGQCNVQLQSDASSAEYVYWTKPGVCNDFIVKAKLGKLESQGFSLEGVCTDTVTAGPVTERQDNKSFNMAVPVVVAFTVGAIVLVAVFVLVFLCIKQDKFRRWIGQRLRRLPACLRFWSRGSDQDGLANGNACRHNLSRAEKKNFRSNGHQCRQLLENDPEGGSDHDVSLSVESAHYSPNRNRIYRNVDNTGDSLSSQAFVRPASPYSLSPIVPEREIDNISDNALFGDDSEREQVVTDVWVPSRNQADETEVETTRQNNPDRQGQTVDSFSKGTHAESRPKERKQDKIVDDHTGKSFPVKKQTYEMQGKWISKSLPNVSQETTPKCLYDDFCEIAKNKPVQKPTTPTTMPCVSPWTGMNTDGPLLPTGSSRGPVPVCPVKPLQREPEKHGQMDNAQIHPTFPRDNRIISFSLGANQVDIGQHNSRGGSLSHSLSVPTVGGQSLDPSSFSGETDGFAAFVTVPRNNNTRVERDLQLADGNRRYIEEINRLDVRNLLNSPPQIVPNSDINQEAIHCQSNNTHQQLAPHRELDLSSVEQSDSPIFINHAPASDHRVEFVVENESESNSFQTLNENAEDRLPSQNELSEVSGNIQNQSPAENVSHQEGPYSEDQLLSAENGRI